MTFEEKKQAGIIFTMHNIDENRPYISMVPTQGASAESVTINGGLSWWDRSKGRYRTAAEQREYEKEVLTKNAKYNAWFGFPNSTQAKELKDQNLKTKDNGE